MANTAAIGAAVMYWLRSAGIVNGVIGETTFVTVVINHHGRHTLHVL